MTSVQIRQSFLDFFKSKGHTIVPSSSLMPDSPGLLFTNAGMNQFVPIFLNERAADVDKWPGAIPGKPTRAADTQKCIRAGGKHNDLEDVGLDTYHHTFFEMLGNWSFGDYFKKEAIEWGWELVAEIWKFPKHRLYATVYSPNKSKGDPSEFDQEAYDFWAEKFQAADLDPKVHLVHGNKKDNFWMMGETGPCGPCSEIHVDLTPAGDTKGSLVNKGDARCIEIWNLVFIQFNANPDGTFSPLPAKHVDTGMGFERVTGIMQNTKGFTDFSRVISNYETDIFRPLFDKIEKLSGKSYKSTLPKTGTTGETEQEKIDVACRVIADHIRTLSFSIADGILPGNNDRNYVLRRILRRAVRYGRTLGFHDPFFYKLVDVLADTMGDIFPEVRKKQAHVQEIIKTEEVAFNKTLDRGLELFNEETTERKTVRISGEFAFKLYDTYGFPLDLTELMARERGMTVDAAGFEKLMEEQRARARAAQKREVIAASHVDISNPTKFVGFEQLTTGGTVLEIVKIKDKTAVTLDVSPLYAEMGGQVGDTGEIQAGGRMWHIVNTQKTSNTFLHFLADQDAPEPSARVELRVDAPRRSAIQRHHTVTHLLHWALHEVVSPDAVQKGSYVGPDKLTFDFSSTALSPAQVFEVEKLVNERILENAGITWNEVSYADVKGRKDVMQFFGEKYGDKVRLVQIGDYSRELCGGTHARATGEIGLFRILSESAVAAGIRRIEAVAGLRAYDRTREDSALISTVAGKVNSPVGELEKKVESLLAQQKELEKQLKSVQQKQAAELARGLAAKAQTFGLTKVVVENMGAVDGEFLQAVTDALKGQFQGVVVLGGTVNGAVALNATVSADFVPKFQAGKIIQAIAPIVGGKGGGKPDNARGGGKDVNKLDEALEKGEANSEGLIGMPPPIPPAAYRSAGATTLARVTGMASCAIVVLALAVGCASGLPAMLQSSDVNAGHWMLGGVAILLLVMGALLGVVGLCARGGSGLYVPALCGTILNGALFVVVAGMVSMKVTAKIQNVANANRQLIELRQKEQSVLTATNASGAIDKSKLERLQKSMQETAQSLNGDDALVMRASADYIKQLTKQRENMDAASADLITAKVLVARNVTNSAQLEERQNLVKRFLGANDQCKEFFQHGAEHYKETLNLWRVSPLQATKALIGYKTKADIVNPITVQIRECDDRIGEAMLGILALEQTNWGHWQVQSGTGKVVFADDAMAQEYNNYMADLRLASADEKKTQARLVAATKAAP